MCQQLYKRGIPAKLVIQIGDSLDDISQLIAYLKQSQYCPIFVSGGMGATHDDQTREGIARGLGLEMEMHGECWGILEHRLKNVAEKDEQDAMRHEAMRLAMLPKGCKLIANELGAPGFVVESVHAFPGFPKMLHAMFEGVLDGMAEMSEEGVGDVEVEDYYVESGEARLLKVVEEFERKWKGRSVSLGIYPVAEEQGRKVKLRLRCPAKEAGAREEFMQMLEDIKQKMQLKVYRL